MFIRRQNGRIVAASNYQQSDIPDEIPDDDAEIIAFLDPLPVITAVSARQFRLQLRRSKLLDAVKAWVAQQDGETQDSFEYSRDFVKESPMMLAGFAAMGFTQQQIDEFFTAAAKL
ncbi:hypothetical protein [Rhizobium sp. H4]|uniref:hypothetical protein n=1 Tax=Rhizobium sp. H4 TaxID=2035449 RepID=UPI001FE16E3D|nr:hypothetical protein [Rhizobium sp. H4]